MICRNSLTASPGSSDGATCFCPGRTFAHDKRLNSNAMQGGGENPTRLVAWAPQAVFASSPHPSSTFRLPLTVQSKKRQKTGAFVGAVALALRAIAHARYPAHDSKKTRNPAQLLRYFAFRLGRLGEAERGWRGCGGGGRKTLGPYGFAPASPALHLHLRRSLSCIQIRKIPGRRPRIPRVAFAEALRNFSAHPRLPWGPR